MKSYSEVSAITRLGKTVTDSVSTCNNLAAKASRASRRAERTVSRLKSSFSLPLCAAISLGLSSSGLYAVVSNVQIVDYAFSPSSVNINVNDQVKWTWYGNYHSATSTTGLWDSGLNNSGHTYSFTFNNAGTYPYECSYHYFSGSVVVKAVSVPPLVSITSPANGTVLSAPASLTLKANATDSSGTVTNVQFFQGTSSLGSVQTGPFSIAVNALSAGNYSFSAVVTDSNGLKATNTVAISVVTPTSNNLVSIQRGSPTSFQFTYAADVGLTYQVQRSSDLLNWNNVDTNTAISTQVLFQDTNTSSNPRFYRVKRMPNP